MLPDVSSKNPAFDALTLSFEALVSLLLINRLTTSPDKHVDNTLWNIQIKDTQFKYS